MNDTGPDYGETRGPLGWGYGLLFGAIWASLAALAAWEYFRV